MKAPWQLCGARRCAARICAAAVQHGTPCSAHRSLLHMRLPPAGRVKTLHPGVHGGILARRDLPQHMDAIGQARATRIDCRPLLFSPGASAARVKLAATATAALLPPLGHEPLRSLCSTLLPAAQHPAHRHCGGQPVPLPPDCDRRQQAVVRGGPRLCCRRCCCCLVLQCCTVPPDLCQLSGSSSTCCWAPVHPFLSTSPAGGG